MVDLANNRAWAYCACSGYGWGLFGHVFSRLSFLSSSLSLGDGLIQIDILSQMAVKLKTTNQSIKKKKKSLNYFCSYSQGKNDIYIKWMEKFTISFLVSARG